VKERWSARIEREDTEHDGVCAFTHDAAIDVENFLFLPRTLCICFVTAANTGFRARKAFSAHIKSQS
jgi:hypothetical protein